MREGLGRGTEERGGVIHGDDARLVADAEEDLVRVIVRVRVRVG